ncbi:MAG: hypothetical protein NXH85_10795 [Pseudomonadaceae bacterium]|nr:hypothetical protein [Pseudomonadaceae bacterium]
MAARLFRFLIALFAVLLVLLALVQLAGRIAMANIDRLEPRLISELDRFGIVPAGLKGRWHRLNPVLEIAELRIPGGHVRDLYVEIDFLESLFRGALTFRRLASPSASVSVFRDSNGDFSIPGLSRDGDSSTAWRTTLRHSDRIQLDGVVSFVDGTGLLSSIALELGSSGEWFSHKLAVTAVDAQGGEIALRQHERAGVLLWRPRAVAARIDSDGFAFDDALVARYQLAGFAFAQLKGFWRTTLDDRGELLSGGQLRLALPPFEFGGETTGATDITVLAHGIDEETIRLEVSDPQLIGVVLPSYQAIARPEDGLLIGELGQADLSPVVSGLAANLAGNELLSRWLTELAIDGSFDGGQFAWQLGSGPAFQFVVSDVDIDGYHGVPTLRAGGGSFLGNARSVRAQVTDTPVELAFPDVFRQQWPLSSLSGALWFYFEPGYMGLKGVDLGATPSFSPVSGTFSLARPSQKSEESLYLSLQTGAVPYADTLDFIPYKLQQNIQSWITDNIRAGDAQRVNIALQTLAKPVNPDVDRRLEVLADVRGASVAYHEDWPEIVATDARLELTGWGTRVSAVNVPSDYGPIGRAQVFLPRGEQVIQIESDTSIKTPQLLRFVRETPIAEWLPIVDDAWSGAGDVAISASLTVPYAPDDVSDRTGGMKDADGGAGTRQAEPIDLEADIQLRALGATLRLEDYRLEFADLQGFARYVHPYQLSSDGLQGSLFDAPASLVLDTRGNNIHLRVSGVFSPADAYEVLAVRPMRLATGRAGFSGDLRIPVEQPGVPMRLSLTSNLEGLEITAPPPLAKTTLQPRSTRVEVDFKANGEYVSVQHGEALLNGWLARNRDGEWEGALGVNARAGVSQDDQVTVTGRAPVLDVAQWSEFAATQNDPWLLEGEPAAEAGVTDGVAAINWQLDRFHAQTLSVGELQFSDVVIDSATLDGSGRRFQLAGETLAAEVDVPDEGPLVLAIDRMELIFPEQEEPAADPLSAEDLSELPDADVTIASMLVDGVDYGSWQLSLRSLDDRVSFGPMTANYNGLTITGEDVYWQRDERHTVFEGTVEANDLVDVLPRFDYAPSIESESMAIAAELSWPGSPLAFDLAHLSGQLDLRVTNGRFVALENGQGAMRIFSLLNFGNVAKRMALDFRDVFGKGVRFDSLMMPAQLNSGVMRFDDELVVKGTGSRFRVAGGVDLGSGDMDAEMIVTLPVSSSLPWYSLYLAAANPLAAAGVLLGQQIFKRPLEQASSAKYRLGGNIDDPEVEFVSLFDRSMSDEMDADAPVAEAMDQELSLYDSDTPASGPVSSVQAAARDAYVQGPRESLSPDEYDELPTDNPPLEAEGVVAAEAADREQAAQIQTKRSDDERERETIRD